MLGEPLTPAGTQYTEWVGTAAFDNADPGRGGLDALLFRVNPDFAERYFLLGAELDTEQRVSGESGHWLAVTLYLVPNGAIPEGGTVADLEDDDGFVPVTKLDVPENLVSEVGSFLIDTFKRINIRVTAPRPGDPFEPWQLRPVDEIDTAE